MGSAFDVAHRLLQETTFVDWSKQRHKPIRYWDERWEYRTKSKSVAWEEIADWHGALEQDRRIVGYLKDKAVSIMAELFDVVQGRTLRLTVAAARDYETAMDDMTDKLAGWSERYGRDVLEEEYSYVRSIDVLIRGDGVHGQWSSVVKGRAKMRERSVKRERRPLAPR